MAAMAEEAGAARVTTASWFMDKPEIRHESHVVLKEEDDWRDLADNDNFDLILGRLVLPPGPAEFPRPIRRFSAFCRIREGIR